MFRKSLWLRGGVALVATAVVATTAGCSSNKDGSGSGATDTAKGPIRVLAVLPTSGAAGPFGNAAKTAIDAAVAVSNADGGALGRKFEIKYVDDAGDPTQAVSLLNGELSSGTHYDFAFIGSTSGEAVAMAPITKSHKLIACSQAAADSLNNGTTNPYYFGAGTSAGGTGAGLIHDVKSKGYTSVAALVTDTELGNSALTAISAAADKAGIPLKSEKLDPTATDATAQLEKLRSSTPQVLVLDAYGPAAAVILSSIKKIGWDVPVIGDADFAANDFSAIPPATAAGVLLNSLSLNVQGSKTTQTPEFQAFSDAMKKQSGGKLPFAAESYMSAYSCVLLFRAGTEIAKSTDSDKVKAALETVTDASQVKGWFSTPNIGFSSTNHKPVYAPELYIDAAAGPRQDMLLPAMK